MHDGAGRLQRRRHAFDLDEHHALAARARARVRRGVDARIAFESQRQLGHHPLKRGLVCRDRRRIERDVGQQKIGAILIRLGRRIHGRLPGVVGGNRQQGDGECDLRDDETRPHAAEAHAAAAG